VRFCAATAFILVLCEHEANNPLDSEGGIRNQKRPPKVTGPESLNSPSPMRRPSLKMTFGAHWVSAVTDQIFFGREGGRLAEDAGQRRSDLFPRLVG